MYIFHHITPLTGGGLYLYSEKMFKRKLVKLVKRLPYRALNASFANTGGNDTTPVFVSGTMDLNLLCVQKVVTHFN